MGRILAIDYGKKRTGLAVTDPLRITPGGLATVASSELLQYLSEYIPREGVDLVVVGYPRQMNNEESESMRYIRPFVAKLEKRFPQLRIVYYDERFTSCLAQKTILESGIGKQKRRNKALVDEVSAIIILQSYMESLAYCGTPLPPIP